MKNIFGETKSHVQQPNRNVFDLSFQSNLSMKIGGLYPVFCKETLPGDSFQIDAAFALKLAPMYFPIQTRLKAYLHFYYVRTRNLWSDWMDYIGKTNTNILTPPYIHKNFSHPFFSTGGIADYLGVPTTFSGNYGTTSPTFAANGTFLCTSSPSKKLNTFAYNSSILLSSAAPVPNNLLSDFIAVAPLPSGYVAGRSCSIFTVTSTIGNSIYLNNQVGVSAGSKAFYIWQANMQKGDAIYRGSFTSTVTISGSTVTCPLDNNTINNINQLNPSDRQPVYLMAIKSDTTLTTYFGTSSYYALSTPMVGTIDITRDNSFNPFGVVTDAQTPSIPLSALPFRAYEQIYNAYYRNVQVDPLIDSSGKPVYNRFILDTAGGKDTYNYEIHNRNWELDFLTSAVPSPQQGTAPLVGLTSNIDGSVIKATADGTTYDFTSIMDNDGVNVTAVKPINPDTPADVVNRLNQTILSGISINDLRNVNSFQRWLETNIRRGLRYKDQIMSHFGVDVKYDELNMPQFIGGCVQDVSINQISSTTQNDQVLLGEYAGQGSVVGSQKNVIHHYCDEHGFIMGILSVVPVPNYSQLLSKYLVKSDPFDYFFPEFGKISMQPITYTEVCPVQTYKSGQSLTSTFGYQRPWYDYLASVDEVHGCMRSSLRDYLMNRIFDVRPELSKSFITITPDQVNNVFNDTSDNDKIFGQVYFDVKAKRPIPRFGIPSLE